MTPELKTLFASAEGQKSELLSRVEALSNGARQSARPGAWSPQQVIAHLVTFEEELLTWISKAASRDRPGPKGAFFATVLSGMMRSAVPMPTLPAFEPGDPAPLPELRARWDQVRARLQERLDTAGDNPAAPFLLHPIAGPLTARQSLSLLDAHLTYHLRRPPLNKPV